MCMAQLNLSTFVSLLTAIGLEVQVGVLTKGVDQSVGGFDLTAAVGADDIAGDEIIDVDDTAVVHDVGVIPDDVTTDVDSAEVAV